MRERERVRMCLWRCYRASLVIVFLKRLVILRRSDHLKLHFYAQNGTAKLFAITSTITVATCVVYLVCMCNLLSIILKVQKVNPQKPNLRDLQPAKAKALPFWVPRCKCTTIFIIHMHIPNASYLSLSLLLPPSLPPTHLQANWDFGSRDKQGKYACWFVGVCVFCELICLSWC